MIMHSVGLSSSQMFLTQLTDHTWSLEMLGLYVIYNVGFLATKMTTLVTLETVTSFLDIHGFNGSVKFFKQS